MSLLKTYKSRRIVNINVNIILASLFSTIGATVVITLIQQWLKTQTTIVVVTAIADSIFNVTFFALLHGFANEQKRQELIKDTAIVQAHRIVLSPLYYGLGAGGQALFMYLGLSIQASIILAYIIAIAISRILHTWYCLRTGFFDDEKHKNK